MDILGQIHVANSQISTNLTPVGRNVLPFFTDREEVEISLNEIGRFLNQADVREVRLAIEEAVKICRVDQKNEDTIIELARREVIATRGMSNDYPMQAIENTFYLVEYLTKFGTTPKIRNAGILLALAVAQHAQNISGVGDEIDRSQGQWARHAALLIKEHTSPSSREHQYADRMLRWDCFALGAQNKAPLTEDHAEALRMDVARSQVSVGMCDLV